MKNKHSKIFTYIGIALVIVVVALLIIAGSKQIAGARANYLTATDTADTAEVADFICDFDAVDPNGNKSIREITLDGLKKPGDSVRIKVNSANFEGSKVCEVAQHCDITFKFNGSMPLIASFEDGGNLSVKPAEETSAVKAFNFNPNTKESKSIYVDIVWPAAENDLKYANGNAIAELAIEFVSTQID